MTTLAEAPPRIEAQESAQTVDFVVLELVQPQEDKTDIPEIPADDIRRAPRGFNMDAYMQNQSMVLIEHEAHAIDRNVRAMEKRALQGDKIPGSQCLAYAVGVVVHGKAEIPGFDKSKLGDWG